MKKIVFEIIQVVIAYVIATIYGYYNAPEPDNKYSWLISAIMLIIIYPIIKLASKKKKKQEQITQTLQECDCLNWQLHSFYILNNKKDNPIF